MTTKTAKFIRSIPGWTGDARLYELSDPVEYGHSLGSDIPKSRATHVIVSATNAMFSGPETYIFPADGKTDDPLDWRELEGSFRGGKDHERALRAAGYVVRR